MTDDNTNQPIQPIPTLQQSPFSGMSTPGAVEELRQLSKQLQQQKSGTSSFKGTSVYTWANGLDDLSRKIVAAEYQRWANQLVQQGTQASGSQSLGTQTPAPTSYVQPNTSPFSWWSNLFGSGSQ